MDARRWVPLTCLIAGVFVFNMSEFTPAGLMTVISADLGVTESQTGMVISAYAWAVGLLALPVMLILKNRDFRMLLISSIAVFGFFQALSGLSDGYMMFMATRLGVAVSHAVFWSIVAPMAVRVVDEDKKGVAIGAISVGTAVALILGVPFGRTVGLLVGWRMTFVSIAIMALVLIVVLLLTFPKVDNPGTFTLDRLPKTVCNRLQLGIYLLLFVFMIGFYECYSYLEPFLKDTGLSDLEISVSLALVGVAGIFAGACFAKFYERARLLFLTVPVVTSCVCMYLLVPMSSQEAGLMMLCFLLGLSISLITSALQAETIGNAPSDGTAVAIALFSGIFNLGIAVGTLIGGFVTDGSGIASIGRAGGSMFILALAVALVAVLPVVRRKYAQ